MPTRGHPNRPDPAAMAAGLALVVLTLLVYLPAIGGGFVWDDDDYVTENPTLRSAEGLARIWLEIGAVPQYYPLVHTTYWIEYRLWGLDPLGYHLVNVLLHGLGAVLAWRVLLRCGVPGAWLAAALFAVHPVHVESVAWITERKNVLSGALYLGAALAYLGALAPGGTLPRRRRGRIALCLVLFLGALLSKTTAATLPCALALVTWWRRGWPRRGEWMLLASMFAAGASLGLVTVWTESRVVGATGDEWSLGIGERLIVAGRALWFYLGKLAWPHPLVFVYPRWSPDAAAAIQYLPLAAAVGAVAVLGALRNRIGRGPLVAALFYAGTLSPALGFFDVYPMRFSFVADHFVYLASLGPLAMASAGAVLVSRRPGRRAVALGAAAALLAALGALTWHQGRIYASEEVLWRDTIEKNPRAFLAHNNLGVLALQRGEAARAEDHFVDALAAKPDFPDALANLGIVRHRQGRVDEAVALYREALRIDPRFADAHNNLGISLASRGDRDGALRHFRQAVRIRPGFANARFNLGVALAAGGRLAEAIDALAEASRLAPSDPDVHLHLGLALERAGRFDDAAAAFGAALELRAGFPPALAGLARVRPGAPDSE